MDIEYITINLFIISFNPFKSQMNQNTIYPLSK